SKSNVLPFELFDGDRNTLTWPSSSDQRIWRLFGMSLQTRNRPTLDQAGPSIQSAPVQSRVMAVFGWTYASKDGSTEMMSGSLKYVVGGASGPKMRGGFVMVVGGAMGPCGVCPKARVPTVSAAAAPLP